jgi:hypothetical protein
MLREEVVVLFGDLGNDRFNLSLEFLLSKVGYSIFHLGKEVIERIQDVLT